jgi:hypothetical protein
MRLRVVAAFLLAALSGCGSSKSSTQPISTALTCDNVVQPAQGLPNGWVQDLGTLAVGTTNVQFTVPAGTASFLIISQEVGRTAPGSILCGGMTLPNAVVPTNVRGPDGALYYDDFVSPPNVNIGGSTYQYPDATGWLAIDQGFQPVVGTLPFPTTSGGLAKLQSTGQVQPGTWSFTLNDWAFNCPFSSTGPTPHGGQYRVQVVTRPSPGSGGPIPASGRLAVEVYLATKAGSPLPDAATASTSPDAARWIASLGHFLSNAGISSVQVTFHDLPASVKNKYAPNGDVNVESSDPCGSLDQLFTSSFVPGQAVHVFLADTLSAPSSKTFRIAGVDGSIPGPSGYPGTISSGAIVGLEDFGFETTPGACAGTGATSVTTCGTDRVAYVAAHEIGHWLGLFHTTEQDGTVFDVLTDTAPCPCYPCAATADKPACSEVPGSKGTTMVTNARCVASATCGGGENLMFWLFDDQFSTGALTPQQGQVARLNPAVQ